MDWAALAAVAYAGLRAGTPLLLASLGELIAQRAGVLNLGIEGVMLIAAFCAFSTTLASGSLLLGVCAACVAAAVVSALHAFLSVSLRANQVVSGLGIVFFATGATELFGRHLVGRTIEGLQPIPIPGLDAIPLLGPALFRHDLFVYLTFGLVLVVSYVLYRTPAGLKLRAVGENPGAADAMGVSVARVRYVATVLGGTMAGLAGAYLSLAYTPLWVPQMTAGRGWMAVALVVFALWRPGRAAAGALLFGAVEALQFRLQAAGIAVAPHLLLMLPYLVTLLALALAGPGRASLRWSAPAALGLPYTREDRV